MICLVIIFIDLLITSFTGHGFVEDLMSLTLCCLIETGITVSVVLLYEVITGKDLL